MDEGETLRIMADGERGGGKGGMVKEEEGVVVDGWGKGGGSTWERGGPGDDAEARGLYQRGGEWRKVCGCGGGLWAGRPEVGRSAG